MIDETPEFPSPSIVDSRRLLGANIYSALAGVVVEVICEDVRADALCAAWAAQVADLARALGWDDVQTRVRREHGGASLFFSAPIDVLMAATEVNEQAWVAAESGETTDDRTVARLRATAESERSTRPNLAEVYAATASREVSANFDEASLCLGSGVGARVWSFAEIPSVADIPWSELGDVPIALVTGSNGKTTTTRLVAAMCRGGGRVAGWSCSDGVWVDDAQLEAGDYSGPGGAREVLRDKRVEAAVLETARGGILRRGLAVTRAAVAIITNVSPDHFGEYGIASLGELAEVKAVVARVLSPAPPSLLVLNADDPHVASLADGIAVPLAWFSAASENSRVDVHAAAGGDVARVVGGRMMLHVSGEWHDLGEVAEMPLTLGGAAPHNVANLLGACLVAAAMGVSVAAIRETANTFGASPADNPGRLQVYRFGGVTVLTDYAHNPDGLTALCKTAETIPAKRRLLILGQAGNRDDELLRALPRAAFEILHFDRVIVKEMLRMLRGRAPGDVPRVLADELRQLGVPADQVEIAPSELAAVRSALAWARDGDLLVCPVHVSKPEVFALLQRARETGWRPGESLPAE